MRSDPSVLKMLKKNMAAAEKALKAAPYDKVDPLLDDFLRAKEAYLIHLRSFY